MEVETRVNKAVSFIEAHLDQPIEVTDIAMQANMSVRSLQRNFSHCVGDSVKNYVRARRLTEASKELVRRPISVLELALKYQFDSYEGFSRSFKKSFLMSPKAFRRVGSPYNAMQRNAARAETVIAKLRGDIKAPEIIETPAKTFVGVKTFQPHYALDTDGNHVVCRSVKRRLMHAREGIRRVHNEDEWSLSFRTDPNMHFHFLEKIYGYEVTLADTSHQGLHTLSIPRGQYAVFQHPAALSRSELVSQAFSWLKSSGLYLADAPCMYRTCHGDQPSYELHLPVSVNKSREFKWWQGYAAADIQK